MGQVDIAIAVQTFNKSDTAIQTLDSLANCGHSEKCKLIIVQDGLEGNRLMGKYTHEHEKTRIAIFDWIERNKPSFKFIEFHPQFLGRGTSGTAKFLIDKALESSGNVIFSEDDVIFESDSLVWFSNMLQHKAFLAEDVWGIAGESKYFDLKGQAATEEQKCAALTFAIEKNILNNFYFMHLMPSSCFATNRSKWQDFGETRGEGHGPRKVAERCKNEDRKVIWPMIARCADIGMHHELGYSMTLKMSKDKIPGKSTYITSGLFKRCDLAFEEISKEIKRDAQTFFGINN